MEAHSHGCGLACHIRCAFGVHVTPSTSFCEARLSATSFCMYPHQLQRCERGVPWLYNCVRESLLSSLHMYFYTTRCEIIPFSTTVTIIIPSVRATSFESIRESSLNAQRTARRPLCSLDYHNGNHFTLSIKKRKSNKKRAKRNVTRVGFEPTLFRTRMGKFVDFPEARALDHSAILP